MATQTFNYPSFVETFTEFATNPSQAALQNYWNMATNYISAVDGFMMSGPQLVNALNLLTAHLAKSFTLISGGQGTAVVTAASEGSVSLSMLPPPAKTGWQFWLASTEYGKMLWAFLDQQGAGGFFIGGGIEREAFRKAGGVFC